MKKIIVVCLSIVLIWGMGYLILFILEKSENNIKVYEKSVINQYSDNNILKTNEDRQAVLDTMEKYLLENKGKYFIYKITRTEETVTATTYFGTDYIVMPQVEGWK